MEYVSVRRVRQMYQSGQPTGTVKKGGPALPGKKTAAGAPRLFCGSTAFYGTDLPAERISAAFWNICGERRRHSLDSYMGQSSSGSFKSAMASLAVIWRLSIIFLMSSSRASSFPFLIPSSLPLFSALSSTSSIVAGLPPSWVMKPEKRLSPVKTKSIFRTSSTCLNFCGSFGLYSGLSLFPTK